MVEYLRIVCLLLLSVAVSSRDPCYPNPCGRNTQCFTTAGRPVCSCLPGHHGNPLTSCQRGECSGIKLLLFFKFHLIKKL